MSGRLGKFCNVFVYRVHWCEKCSASTGLHSFSCLRHSFQSADHDVRMNVSFRVNACLCCSSVSSLLPAIFSCRAILLRHTLRLSDCPTSFTLPILTLLLHPQMLAFSDACFLRCLLPRLLASDVRCRLFFIMQLLLVTWCLHQVAVLHLSPQILALLPVIHNSSLLFQFFK